MRDFLPIRRPAPECVDWRPPQDKYFARLTMSYSQLSRETGDRISADQIGRWASTATPIPAHQIHLLEWAARDDTLSAYHARQAGKIIVNQPHPRKEENMDVYQQLKDAQHELDKLHLLRLQKRLTRDEREHYESLCNMVARIAIALRETIQQIED